MHPLMELLPNFSHYGSFCLSLGFYCSRSEATSTSAVSQAKGLVINYGEGGGGLKNGKIAGPNLFVPPPLKTG